MRITDAQVHVWSAGTSSGEHRKVPRFTAEDLLAEMDEAGVDAAIIHPPSWDPNANTVAIEAVRNHPGPFAILGQFPLDQPQQRARLETWRDQPGMLGLRTALVLPHQQTSHEDGTLDWLWPELERLELPFATMAWRFLPTYERIAERHPHLRLIIDHCGGVRPAKDDAAFATVPELERIARLPNVALKATGAPGYATSPYPFRNPRSVAPAVRCVWAGPVFLGHRHHPHAVQLQAVRDDVHGRAAVAARRDLETVMGEGIRAWLGWTD